MRIVLVLLLVFAARIDLVAAAPATPRCAEDVPHIVDVPRLMLAASSKPAAEAVAFAADLGSDGRVRDMQLLQSSGDLAVDAQVREALQKAAYRPGRTRCVSYSSIVTTGYRLTDASPAPPAPPAPVQHTANCVPFVTAYVSPVRSDKGKRGTVTVAVDLDAAGSLRAARLAKSSGTPALDTEAVNAANAGSYNFMAASPCLRQPTTYFLELTFE